ncbi:MAG: polyphosphate glucokinase [Desulfuromonas sp.]|nr:MAG: polyphosphate glucokinase [Desulfuromonas sp.]
MRILGVDIGGSSIKGGPVDLSRGELTAPRLSLPTPIPATPQAVADRVAEISRHFQWQGVIGCGVPAVVRNGTTWTAANIDRGWIGFDVGQLLATTTRCKVTVLNDADAAGLAEMKFGNGCGQSGTVLMITLGTGLGSALFRDGRLIPNTELGHLLINDDVAERYASAAVKQQQQLSYQAWAGRLDRYLQRLNELLWPDLLILGGEISREHDQFLPLLTVSTRVVPALLGNDAGIIGAALAAAAG